MKTKIIDEIKYTRDRLIRLKHNLLNYTDVSEEQYNEMYCLEQYLQAKIVALRHQLKDK